MPRFGARFEMNGSKGGQLKIYEVSETGEFVKQVSKVSVGLEILNLEAALEICNRKMQEFKMVRVNKFTWIQRPAFLVEMSNRVFQPINTRSIQFPTSLDMHLKLTEQLYEQIGMAKPDNFESIAADWYEGFQNE